MILLPRHTEPKTDTHPLQKIVLETCAHSSFIDLVPQNERPNALYKQRATKLGLAAAIDARNHEKIQNTYSKDLGQVSIDEILAGNTYEL